MQIRSLYTIENLRVSIFDLISVSNCSKECKNGVACPIVLDQKKGIKPTLAISINRPPTAVAFCQPRRLKSIA